MDSDAELVEIVPLAEALPRGSVRGGMNLTPQDLRAAGFPSILAISRNPITSTDSATG